MQAPQHQNIVSRLKLNFAKNHLKPGSNLFMKYPFLHFSFIFLSIGLCAQDTISHMRPKIGLTLSGGGAKGLAPIGILKAIDSAGLKIDYITGTSMGGIIGALYAVGYSADSIEKLAKNIDWDLLL